jgi:excisionase family DNA binding protein
METMEISTTPFYTPATLAKRLGVKVSSIHWRIENGDIPARKMGRRTVILASDLEASLNALPVWTPEA